MKITLTNAHRIRKSLEGVVAGKNFTRDISTSIKLSVYETDISKQSVIEEKFTASRKVLTKEISNLLDVLDVLANLRSKIASVNRSLNIAELLDKESAVSQKIRIFNELSKEVPTVESGEILSGRLNRMIERNADVNNRYGSESEITVSIMDSETISSLKKRLLEAQREQRNLLDKITAINSSNYITLSAEEVVILEKLGIV